MIGLDTNVLVRFVTADHPTQSPAAQRLLATADEGSPVYVPLLVLAELHWVLTRAYGFSSGEVLSVLEGLLDSDGVVMESPQVVRPALRDAAGGADLADALIGRVCAGAGCGTTVTFDRLAARNDGFKLLEA